MIATLFGKKKITEEKLSNVFVNAAIELTEHGFAAVAAEINESPEFDVNPALAETDDRAFGMIVLAANLIEAKRVLGPGVDKRMCSLVVSKLRMPQARRTRTWRTKSAVYKARWNG